MGLKIFGIFMVHLLARKDDDISLYDVFGPVHDQVADTCMILSLCYVICPVFHSSISYFMGKDMFCNPKVVSARLAGISLVIRQPSDQVHPDAARFLVID